MPIIYGDQTKPALNPYIDPKEQPSRTGPISPVPRGAI
jgi:hypothetical protein